MSTVKLILPTFIDKNKLWVTFAGDVVYKLVKSYPFLNGKILEKAFLTFPSSQSLQADNL